MMVNDICKLSCEKKKYNILIIFIVSCEKIYNILTCTCIYNHGDHHKNNNEIYNFKMGFLVNFSKTGKKELCIVYDKALCIDIPSLHFFVRTRFLQSCFNIWRLGLQSLEGIM